MIKKKEGHPADIGISDPYYVDVDVQQSKAAKATMDKIVCKIFVYFDDVK